MSATAYAVSIIVFTCGFYAGWLACATLTINSDDDNEGCD